MARGKMQSEQQIIDEEGQKLLRSVLPSHWVLREYRPDFGLDFALELFRQRAADPDGPAGAKTLGEHIFIQLKSARSPEPFHLSLKERTNVQKTAKVTRGTTAGSLETYRQPLEVEELVTVERMGVGVPVLLVVADLAEARCSFVCLNDYIDRVLIPTHVDYRKTAKRTVHVPLRNDLSTVRGQAAVGWYGKRAKLMAAFQRFHYQLVELEYAQGDAGFFALAQVFASKIGSYDFWDSEGLPASIYGVSAALQRFIETGSPFDEKANRSMTVPVDHERVLREQRVLDLWRKLALLGRTLEDTWEEWYLPTALGHMLTPPENASR